MISLKHDIILNDKGLTIYENINFVQAHWEDTHFFVVCKNQQFGILSSGYKTIIPIEYEAIDIHIIDEDKVYFVLKNNGLYCIIWYNYPELNLSIQFDYIEISEFWQFFIAEKNGVKYKIDLELFVVELT